MSAHNSSEKVWQVLLPDGSTWVPADARPDNPRRSWIYALSTAEMFARDVGGKVVEVSRHQQEKMLDREIATALAEPSPGKMRERPLREHRIFAQFNKGRPMKPSPIALSKIEELSEDDLGTLERAADLRHRFDAGIFPSTIGQRSHFQKLVRLGLLEFDGWGRDMDGEVDRDVELYKLTERGTAIAERSRAVAFSTVDLVLDPGC